MVFLTVSLYEFRQFLQILMWIAIPVIVISIIVTVVVHRWRKKRNEHGENEYPQDADNLVMPQVGELPAETEPAYQGMLWLRSKYQHDIALADEKHEKLLLQNKALEQKYLDLLTQLKEPQSSPEKTADPELQNKLEEYKQEIHRLESLVVKKEQQPDLVQTPSAARAENDGEIQVVPENTSEYETLKQQLAWTEQEKESLKKNIVEQGTLRDLLEEKSSQIVFLQGQLEERIKHFHEAESRSKEDMSRVNELQYTVFNIRKENQQQQEDIRNKTVLVEKMGKELQAMQEQSSAHISLLDEKLAHEIEQVKNLESKLAFSHKLLQKIQDEIGTSFEKQMILYTNDDKPEHQNQPNGHPKISAWIESPSEEEEYEHII